MNLDTKKIQKTLLKNKIAAFTLFTYIGVLLFYPQIGLDSLRLTTRYLREMLMVLPAIFILMGLIEVWVSRDTILRILGKESGIKGILASIMIGSFSAGPIYAAFPVCYTLLRKGSSVSNVVIILSAWAVIKVPELIIESQFLGLQFMLARYIFTVPAIIGIGLLTGKLVRKEELMDNTLQDALVLSAKIAHLLPGYNCGACGQSSCHETAEKLVSGERAPSICPIIDDKRKEEIRQSLP